MSRIGRKPIVIPAGVEVKIDGHDVTVKGPKGTLHSTIHSIMTATVENGEVVVTRPNDEKEARSLHGLTRTLIGNMVEGVTNGYKKELEIQGVGYRAAKQGKDLVMNLGYSHPVCRVRNGRHHHRSARSPEDRHQRHRQTARRTVCRESAREAPARTVQGQRHPLCGRARHPSKRARPARAQNKIRSERDMVNKPDKNVARLRRHRRVRGKISGTAACPRLDVFRSSKHIYAQLIDDEAGVTLASASSMDKDFEGFGGNIEAATKVGKVIAKKAAEKGITKAVYDRGGFVYHGRVKALADGAREGGLEL